MRKLLANIRSGKTLLCDGAIGTELQKKGLVPGESPELMNIEKPDVVRSIYAAYKAAGSDTCGTNTFGGNRGYTGQQGYVPGAQGYGQAQQGYPGAASGQTGYTGQQGYVLRFRLVELWGELARLFGK